ncbi:hypothetical protein CHLNCDRAFT_51470 [Chlorella variabilis]|uniref:SERRATE/Ars2 C-terminal domain-containing protein n=1 Tax=Chlorella variabilis TaxID=554065 RepID=E1ZBV4_CHLVA|nr:hypothetical protein CHLNCDRAFT_51470 [Chlorella variabilis]EFN56708.1 hypothetical protein CHLNCDRAFT_51470 [Chlorella variabilis]|eukprot:XP_005848810.1 hypothetical protein CHLNCDRAFT_51470 [Chlorella variabilis]
MCLAAAAAALSSPRAGSLSLPARRLCHLPAACLGCRGPLTFVEFVRDLPPHVGPDQANDEYRRYMADWWGDAIKAEFEQRKGDPILRRQFDPREIRRVVERRDQLAAAAASGFAEELEAGGGGGASVEEEGGPGPEGFSDAAAADSGGARGGEEAPPPALAPALCWQPAQLAADLALAKQLARAADKEKGVAGNPLLPAAAGGGGGEAQEGEAAAAAEGGADMDAELSPEETAAKLDQLLRYLWRVHGIDFYGGREYSNPAEPGRAAARRTLRGPKPSDADLAAAAEAEAEAEAEKAAAEKAAQAGEAAAGDGEAGAAAGAAAGGNAAAGEASAPAEAAGGAAEAEAGAASPAAAAPAAAASPTAAAAAGKQVAAAQQQQQGGGGGSSEEGREYERRVTGFWRFRLDKGDPLLLPLQRQRVEEEVERFVQAQIIKIDDQKWGNKLSQKLFMGREFVVKHIRNKHGHVVEAERERIQEEVYWENFRAYKQEEQRRQEEEQERVMASMGGGGGGGRGRGRGRGIGPLEPAALPLNPGMMMAPIIMPAAGGMAPMILPMDVVMGMGMGGGVGGARGGRGRGGRGGMAGRGPKAGYFDLDAPQNNRAVLDYGDL